MRTPIFVGFVLLSACGSSPERPGRCADGTVFVCRCERDLTGTTTCVDGALQPCTCETECAPGTIEPCLCGTVPGTATCLASGRLGECECDTSPAECTPGRSLPCICSDGHVGVQTCEADGTFSECRCEGGPIDAPDAWTPLPDAGPPPDGCIPATCSDLLASCGRLRDGCGRAIDCGPCRLDRIRRIEVPARDLEVDPSRGLLYVSTPGSAGVRGNAVLAFDPGTGGEVWNVVVGSEPGPLAITDDASRLWVGLNAADSLRAVDLATRTVGPSYAVGTTSHGDVLHAGEIEAIPGSASAILVSTRRRGVSPDFGGVFVFDEGVRRPMGTRDHTGARMIEVASPTRAYGFNNASTEFGFRDLVISASGVVEGTVTEELIDGFGTDIVYEGGLIFATDGSVVDPTIPMRVGRLPVVGPVAPEAATNRVYVVVGSGPTMRSAPFWLVSLDRTTLVEIGRVMLTDVTGPPRRLRRWGDRGVAFLEGPDSSSDDVATHLVVVTSNLISPPP